MAQNPEKSWDVQGPPESAPFSDLYKYSHRTVTFSQEKRRELFLQKQKEKRGEAVDEKRDLSELFSEFTRREPKRKSRNLSFEYKLMKSEWLQEVPDDLADSWLVKLCPEGVRYLVVAHKAITTCYWEKGHISRRFKSGLPGGNSNSAHKFTVLDCIYCKAVNTLFVYDVLAWNSMSLINAEAQMRFFWLKSKFTENPDMCAISRSKNFNFMLIECFPAQNALLQDHMFTPFVINEVELTYNGVLFYHKEGHYVCGRSPLVGWLKAFMLPEILRIDVHPSHLHAKPQDYESLEQYLLCKKKNKKSKKRENMEVVEIEEESIECDNM